jgi:uncharacterized membrane-anchored protein
MIPDDPLRYSLVNELHARPFPVLQAPGQAAYLAIKQPGGMQDRDRQADRDNLVALLDRFGAPHPQPDATHYSGQIGRYRLKWESHTEFVAYTILGEGLEGAPFDGRLFRVFPEDWLMRASGQRITSALIRVEPMPEPEELAQKLQSWFVAESLATSHVVEEAAVIAGDFRVDPEGHMRFAVFVPAGTGPNRTGRIVQRLTEIETYKTMSMFGLAMVRANETELGIIDHELARLAEDMTRTVAPDVVLKALLKIGADLEALTARTSFRFGATGAYRALVEQRIEVLRETRFEGRQTFAEFMMRRFDPAMRTVESAERRLADLATRVTRASDLLRTQVDVERSAQNQQLLESMDRRADVQLRLQKTVEGLSVVAISYYGVNLALYLLGPLAHERGIDKTWLAALATPAVIILVWLLVHRIRRRME